MGLHGRLFAVSIGGAPDLGKLGFPKREVQRVLLTVCGALVRSGATVAYGGDLRPGGFTIEMYQHLAGAYADRETVPFVHYLAKPSLRRVSFDDLVASLRESAPVAKTLLFLGDRSVSCRASDHTLLLTKDGVQARLHNADELAEWLSQLPDIPDADVYSSMRQKQSADADARIAMGGKMGILSDPQDQYEGSFPGVVEEALLTIEAGKPLVALGAFGGATRDIAIALDLLPGDAASPRREQASTYWEAIQRVRFLSRKAVPGRFRNELRTLASSERAEEIAQGTVALLARWLR